MRHSAVRCWWHTVLTVLQVLNAVVGVWQESNAEKALEALKELQSEHAKVVRDGKLVSDVTSGCFA